VSKQPVLSIVVSASNADYGGKFLPRLQRMIDDKAAFATGFINDIVELIVVEWNPPIERPRLIDVIKWPPNLRTKVITVPKELHESYYNPGKFSFLEYMAKNVGIRRARGVEILATNADIIFSAAMAKRLWLSRMSEFTFYRANRYDWDVNEKVYQILYANGCFTPGEAVTGRSKTGVPYRENMPHFNASGDFMMMTRTNWHKLRAYPENTGYMITLDGEMVHIALRSGLEQTILPEPIYHQYHDHSPVKPWYMPPQGWSDATPRGTMNATDNDWGLANEELETVCMGV
jgi:hypothetical protein